MNFRNGFHHEENAAGKKNEIADSYAVFENFEERIFVHAHNPGNTEKQAHAQDHRHGKTDIPGAALPFLRQTPGDDGHENDIVDAQHHFQNRKGKQTDQAVNCQ
ncbi:MAG: hypothetical protein FD123_2365 [Bacteroidetes bacterium]|nr:MAG: hypothetical protein FD123_2365 [Bacteroidota bacterium]